ncbi:hypothetical protein ACQ4N7_29245 [Nodosilinea sp. AN01ver1]|uniref:hypothetical protein n=1 Tax=Nodosilinea sp. AN01ver1 TaxID=3423362 RepID=UPI003D31A37E
MTHPKPDGSLSLARYTDNVNAIAEKLNALRALETALPTPDLHNAIDSRQIDLMAETIMALLHEHGDDVEDFVWNVRNVAANRQKA